MPDQRGSAAPFSPMLHHGKGRGAPVSVRSGEESIAFCACLGLRFAANLNWSDLNSWGEIVSKACGVHSHGFEKVGWPGVIMQCSDYSIRSVLPW